jgi:integrase
MGWAEEQRSGRYRAMYRDAAGKRRSAGIFTHKRAAEKAADVAENDARKLGWRDPSIALMPWGEWVAEWWPTRAVEPGTLRVDQSRLNARLMPYWQTTPLAAITRQDVRAWIAQLSRTDLAPATVQRCVSLFSASLAAAVDAEILPANPASRMQVVKGETAEQRYLTRPEFAAIAAAMPSAFDEALASTLVATGMRWGEGIGLQIPRIDFERGSIRVAEGWDDRMGRVKPYPKGRKIRDVPLPGWLASHLQPLVDGRRTGQLWAVDDRVPDYHNWRSRVWIPALKKADIGHVRIHDLRHTYASWLIQDGVPLEEVGRLLGHVSPLTTRAYAHLAESPRQHILDALPDPSRVADAWHAQASGDYAPLRRITPRTAESQGN